MASEPVRTCVGCRERAAKRELVRVTVGSDAHGRPAVVPDTHGTAPGRGAHLHPTAACYELAVRRKAFGRALRWQGPGGLESAAVATWVTEQDRQDQQDQTETDQREEGWSSSS